ncbi:hypothetical protein [Paraburkholderia sp.]|uniref:hypothetical protein n=1 Tax=Paraburkholderia sp. TaxID=1926495 RepID=UPI00239D1DA6|nr:hypothetical protein [Paraburkholderia sp.]MDE1181587.1 hypothetical protein [Paraburkholderia sp.]
MKHVTMKMVLGCTAMVSMAVSSVVFAGGGNGNGGSGGGGAHGAATAGMTYHSEPVTSPWPGKDMKEMDMKMQDMHRMPSGTHPMQPAPPQ